MIPGKAKFAVTIVGGVESLLALPAVPEGTGNAQRLVDEKAIKAAFESFPQDLHLVDGFRSFYSGSGNTRVFFKPDDLNSLHYFCTSRAEADDYAVRIGLDKPFNVPRYDGRDGYNLAYHRPWDP